MSQVKTRALVVFIVTSIIWVQVQCLKREMQNEVNVMDTSTWFRYEQYNVHVCYQLDSHMYTGLLGFVPVCTGLYE